MDKLTLIKTYVEVASCGSFTQAAAQLGLSRLQVTRHIQQMEGWLKQRLLHRTTRKVSMTPAGEQALGYCQRILNETLAMELNAEEQRQQLSGVIRIAAPIGLAQNLLLEVIDEFTQLHPRVVIDVLVSDINAALVEDRVDVALRFTQAPDDSLIARKLMNIECALLASPQYLQEFGIPLKPGDLASHHCLVHVSNPVWRFNHNGQSIDVTPHSNIKANALEMLLTLAQRGKGIVWSPCDLANPCITEGTLIPVLTDYYVFSSPLWAVYLSRSYQTPRVRHFIDFIASRWAQDITLAH